MTIPIHQKRVIWTLSIIAAVLVVLSVTANFLTYAAVDNPLPGKVSKNFERLFDLDAEANIPTWFQVALLLTCAILLAINGTLHNRKYGRDALYWAILSLAFFYLSVDELASIHDMANVPVKVALHTGGALRFAWIIPAGILTALFGVAYIKFLVNLPRRTAFLFVLAGAIYVGGAIGVEAIGGMYSAIHGENFSYKLITTVEESAEMIGLILFIYSNMDYFEANFGEVSFQLDAARPKSSAKGSRFRAVS